MKFSQNVTMIAAMALFSPTKAFRPTGPQRQFLSNQKISKTMVFDSGSVTTSESIELLPEADAIFDSIDTDCDGSITGAELKNHLMNTMGYSADSPQCRYLFEAFDSDRSGEISREELRAAFCSQNYGAVALYMTFGLGGSLMTSGLSAEVFNERVQQITDRTRSDPTSFSNKVLLDDLADLVFDLIDTDKSGVIDKKELREHFDRVTDQEGTEKQAKEYVETIFSVLDIDSDGVVNREEMKDAFKKYDFRFLYTTLGLPAYNAGKSNDAEEEENK
mmetsp:Transcript_25460/g.38441  ORF Transcript_25460/g.38441 Transcript_25460/m.38441 type:complete len:276 (-) Transcript_25460:105-932(-)